MFCFCAKPSLTNSYYLAILLNHRVRFLASVPQTIKITGVRKSLCLKTIICYFGLIRKMSKIEPQNPWLLGCGCGSYHGEPLLLIVISLMPGFIHWPRPTGQTLQRSDVLSMRGVGICELQVRHWWLSNLPIFCAFCLPMFEYMNWISSCRQMLRTCGMIGTVACWGRNESMKINSTEQDSKRCGRWMATCSWSGERGGLERRHKLNFLCLCALVFLHIFQQEHWEVESKCAIILVSFHSDTSWLFKMSSWFSLGKKKNRSKFITAIHIPSCLYVFYRFP